MKGAGTVNYEISQFSRNARFSESPIYLSLSSPQTRELAFFPNARSSLQVRDGVWSRQSPCDKCPCADPQSQRNNSVAHLAAIDPFQIFIKKHPRTTFFGSSWWYPTPPGDSPKIAEGQQISGGGKRLLIHQALA